MHKIGFEVAVDSSSAGTQHTSRVDQHLPTLKKVASLWKNSPTFYFSVATVILSLDFILFMPDACKVYDEYAKANKLVEMSRYGHVCREALSKNECKFKIYEKFGE